MKSYFINLKCYSQKFFENLKRKVNTLYLASVAFKQINFSDYLTELDSSSYMLSQSRIDILHTIIPGIHQAKMKEIMNLVGGTWYHCPNGHLYTIGECGRPMQQSSCPECNSMIGGANHISVANNTQFRGFDNI